MNDHTTDHLAAYPLLARLSGVGQRLRKLDSRRPWLFDAAAVVVAFVFLCVPDLVHSRGDRDGFQATPLPVPAIVALQLALILPLYWRRRAPTAAFYVVTAVFMVQWALGAVLRADVALLIAIYSLVLRGHPWRLPWAGVAVSAAMTLVAVRVSVEVSLWDALFLGFATATAAAALGFAIRIRRAQLDALRDRAVRLEIERDQRSRLAAATERTRVAREMHDIVGHSLSVIISLADGGAYAIGANPLRGREALGLIGDTSRQALAELRRMLGVLRDDAAPDAAPALHPQPDIGEIAALCDRVRAAGPAVVYRTTGDVDALGRGVQLTAYRIVQEALTNALRYAGPRTSVELALVVDGSRLEILVRDTGPSRTGDLAASSNPIPGSNPISYPNSNPMPVRGSIPGSGSVETGHGLVGMRERAAMFGGTVEAGPRPGGGWTVRATLDLTPSAVSEGHHA